MKKAYAKTTIDIYTLLDDKENFSAAIGEAYRLSHLIDETIIKKSTDFDRTVGEIHSEIVEMEEIV